MSCQETRIGKIKLVKKLEHETLEDQCKRLIGSVELPEYYDTYKEFFYDHFDDEQYVIYKNDIYEVMENKRTYDDIFIANRNEDGIVSYVTSYYNGGCGYYEAIEECLDNLDK